MEDSCYILNNYSVETLQNHKQAEPAAQLEEGKIIYLPGFSFPFLQKDNHFLTDSILNGTHKNISFDCRNGRLSGYNRSSEWHTDLKDFMERFNQFARTMVETLLPTYKPQLLQGRTSYRPAEIKGRSSSKRKDDTRLHVDAFPSTPVNGLRILRVFCNINPYGEPRVWQVGEPFQQVLKRFYPKISPYSPSLAHILHWIKATKTLRSPYDHFMLQLHDRMKLDNQYQNSVLKKRLSFPPNSSWIVFTDSVSHAALSGQYLLEQTFYLPVEAMLKPELSPLKQWEKNLSLQTSATKHCSPC